MRKIFIGSSSGAKKKADVLRRILQDLGAESVSCWFDPDVFIPGDSTLDNLLKLTHECNGAVFIFDKDDEITDSYGAKRYVTRDNVILEAGLFISALGKDAVVICRVPDAHMLSDYSGVTHLLYDPDDHDHMKKILQGWLTKRVRGDRFPKSENNVFIKSRDAIHRRYSLNDEFYLDKDKFSHIRKIRLMNMAGNLVTGSAYTDPAHERPGMTLSQVIRRILEKADAVLELMLLEPNAANLRDAATRMPNPNARLPEELVYASWNTICKNVHSDDVYRIAYQSRRFRCYALKVGMPYAIFGIEYDTKHANYNHVKIDLYSSNLGDAGQRRSFIIWQDTDPENYDFFTCNFDNIRGDRSICYQVDPAQIDMNEIAKHIKLSEINHKLQENPQNTELLISKADLLYDMDCGNYPQSVQILMYAMYLSPYSFEAYDRFIEIAVKQKDGERVLAWSAGARSLAIPEGMEHAYVQAKLFAASARKEKPKDPRLESSQAFEIASVYFKCILQATPHHEQALLHYGELLRYYEYYDDALEIWERLATLFPTDFHYCLCADTCLDTKRANMMKEFCEKGLNCPDTGFHQKLRMLLYPGWIPEDADMIVQQYSLQTVGHTPVQNTDDVQEAHEKILSKLLRRNHTLDVCQKMDGFTKDCAGMLKTAAESPAGILGSAERIIVLELARPDSDWLTVTVTKYFNYIYADRFHPFSVAFLAGERQARTYHKISLKIDGEDYTSRLQLEVVENEGRAQLPYLVRSNKIPLQNEQCQIEYTAAYECCASQFFQSARVFSLCREFKAEIFLGEAVRREYELICATFSPFSKIHYDDYKAGEMLKPYTERIVLPRWSLPGSGYVITLKRRSDG